MIRIGTRASKLAMWQAKQVQARLEAAGLATQIVEITTKGDLVQDVALHKVGSVGLFTKQLDLALLKEEIDVAVHSAKDMPSWVPEGIELAGFMKREDPRDVLLAVSEEVHFENFSRKLVIGSSSLRRQAFMKSYFEHVEIKDIRGNVDSRIAKMETGDYDGIILAYAGVKRMGMERYIVQKLNVNAFVPAVGQGSVAVACREAYEYKAQVREAINHIETEVALRCERAFLRQINGGCQVPVFGFATVLQDHVSLTAGMANEAGYIARHSMQANRAESENMGRKVADAVLAELQSV